MNELSDDVLIEFSQGSPQAFQTIFDSFRMRIFYFVNKFTSDRLAAEDITADTFVKLHRLHDRFNTINNIQAFLFITARNASLDYLRSRERERHAMTELRHLEEQEVDFPLFAETNIEADVLKFIYTEIEKLPNRTRRIFKLFYLEGYTIKDIAELMQIKQRTVINLKQTALKGLRIKALDRPDLLLLLLCLLQGTRD
jgi:RNA polymerase sigma-70 factor (ECF subfamily)